MRSTILGTRTLHGAAIVAAALLSVVLIGPGLADAGLGAGATPTFPAVVTVGDTGVPATIQMQNDNTTPNTSATLSLPSPLTEVSTLTPLLSILNVRV